MHMVCVAEPGRVDLQPVTLVASSTAQGNKLAANLRWQRPVPNGIIIFYEVSIVGMKSSAGNNEVITDFVKTFKASAIESNDGVVRITIGDLQGNTTYDFKVRANTSIGYGDFSNIRSISTPTTEPPGPTGFIEVGIILNSATFVNGSTIASTVTTTTLPAVFQEASDENGAITHYAIIALEAPSELKDTDPKSYFQYRSSTAKQKPPFYAFFGRPTELEEITVSSRKKRADTDDKTLLYLLGTNMDCQEDDGICNGELLPGTSYRFKTRAYTQTKDSDPAQGLFTESNFSEPVSTNADARMTTNDVVAIAAAVPGTICVLVFVCAALMFFYFKRFRGRRNYAVEADRSEMTVFDVEPLYAEISEDGSASALSKTIYLKEWPEYTQFHFDRNKLEFHAQLGEGNFKTIWKAAAVGITEENEKTEVTVTAITQGSPIGAFRKFNEEIRTLAEFHHVNIIKLLGACLLRVPFYMITEVLNKGDLKDFVRRARPNLSNPIPIPRLSLHQLIDICRQVACGLSYLAKQKFVHRDIAARNCLVGEKEDKAIVVKIGNFGLAEDIYEANYCRRKQGVLPLPWMSPEAIGDGKFTVKSDMWSFGVLMWEVFSLGLTPYFGLDSEQVKRGVLAGSLSLSWPPGCPEKVCDLMSSCWKVDVSNRMSAEEMEKKLKVLNDMVAEFGQDAIGARPMDKKSTLEFIQSFGYQSSASATNATIRVGPESSMGITADKRGYLASNMERIDNGLDYEVSLTVNEAYQKAC